MSTRIHACSLQSCALALGFRMLNVLSLFILRRVSGLGIFEKFEIHIVMSKSYCLEKCSHTDLILLGLENS